MKALVTGGGGFLGKAIIKLLRERDDEVRSFSRNPHPALTELGVEHCRGELSDAEAVKNATEGCDIVFHVAAKAVLRILYYIEYFIVEIEDLKGYTYAVGNTFQGLIALFGRGVIKDCGELYRLHIYTLFRYDLCGKDTVQPS